MTSNQHVNPRVSIVTVSLNSAETIAETIESVLSQSYPHIEYIVIDGASTDKTMDIVHRYADQIDKRVSEPDKGIYDAMNKGIRLASGDIVGILNADDTYDTEKVIEKVVEKMKQSGADCLWGNLVYVDRKDTRRIVRNWVSSEYKKGCFQKGWHPPHPTFFVKKSLYDRYGLYDLSLPVAADYELMLRFLEKYKVKSCYIPENLIKMKTGGASSKAIARIFKINMDCYRAWKINALKINPLRIILRPLSKIPQYFYD